MADEFAGLPEERFLLRMASAMEELALVKARMDSLASRYSSSTRH